MNIDKFWETKFGVNPQCSTKLNGQKTQNSTLNDRPKKLKTPSCLLECAKIGIEKIIKKGGTNNKENSHTPSNSNVHC